MSDDPYDYFSNYSYINIAFEKNDGSVVSSSISEYNDEQKEEGDIKMELVKLLLENYNDEN